MPRCTNQYDCIVTREHRVTCHSDYIYMMLEWSSCCFTSSSSSFLACNSRLCSTIRRHHPPQRAVLSQICCFGEHKVVLFQILLDGAEHMMRGRPSCLLQSAGGEANRILLASALSSMCIICPNRVNRERLDYSSEFGLLLDTLETDKSVLLTGLWLWLWCWHIAQLRCWC